MCEPVDPIVVSPAAKRHHLVRLAFLTVGVLLLIATPIVGVLPGPGGVVTFAAGMALVLRNSLWAKRRYVILKRRWPKCGNWADWSMRRASARRRAEVAKTI